MKVTLPGVEVEYDATGELVRVVRERPLADREIRRILEAQGPIPSDPEAAQLRRDNDAILKVGLSGKALTVEAVEEQVRRDTPKPPPQRTMVDQEAVDALQRNYQDASALSRQLSDIMSRIEPDPEDEHYIALRRARWVLDRHWNRTVYMLELAQRGQTGRELSPISAYESKVIPLLPQFVAEMIEYVSERPAVVS